MQLATTVGLHVVEELEKVLAAVDDQLRGPDVA
jgi:hypothetical protein